MNKVMSISWTPPTATGGIELVRSDTPTIANGFKSIIQSIPCANGGDLIGPSSNFEFYLRPSPLGFIKPNSMYLRAKVVVEGTPTTWSFAGQCGYAVDGTGDYRNCSPAASVLEKIDIIFPNGQQMEYNSYDVFEWLFTHSYILDQAYVYRDLKVLEACHTQRPVGAGNLESARTSYVVIPINLPLFNAHTGFPLCLMNGPITIRMRSNTVPSGFHTTGSALTSYSLSEMSLVYEEIRVSFDYKRQLLSLPNPYTILVNDRRYLGTSPAVSQSTRLNINVGLSSLKGVVWGCIERPTTTGNYKTSRVSALNRWSLYVDNLRINTFEIDDYPTCFAEFNRAIQSIFDYTRAANLFDIVPGTESGLNTTYLYGQFVAGLSTAVFNANSLTMSGIPVSQISVEIMRGNSNANKWGNFNGVSNNTYNAFWAFHDSIVQISSSGDVIIKR